MKRGKRNHFVQFQTCTNAVWSNAFQQWISLEPTGQLGDYDKGYHCETHYNANINHLMRFIEGSRTFQVISVTNVDENYREMIIEVVEHLKAAL